MQHMHYRVPDEEEEGNGQGNRCSSSGLWWQTPTGENVVIDRDGVDKQEAAFTQNGW